MIIEVATVILVIQGVTVLSRLIERRRDVLYYVSKPDPQSMAVRNGGLPLRC